MARTSRILLYLFTVVLVMIYVYMTKLYGTQPIPNISRIVKYNNNINAIFSINKREDFHKVLPVFPNVALDIRKWLGEEYLSWNSSF